MVVVVDVVVITRIVELEDAVPGEGEVRIADGKDVAISERGNLGPLRGVEKVPGFQRLLVSASRLADQFGTVEFDSTQVAVRTRVGGAQVHTRIGRRTRTGLFSFDIDALETHRRKCLDANEELAAKSAAG